MPRHVAIFMFSIFLASVSKVSAETPESSNNIEYPAEWTHWSTIGVTHRNDNNTLRVILGNDTAVRAARAGKTHPWPDGTVIGKVVWKDAILEHWNTATVPGQFVHAEFMFKDSNRYRATEGWGWARWVGLNQEPFNEGPEVCITCHTPVKSRDMVFTEPALFPSNE